MSQVRYVLDSSCLIKPGYGGWRARHGQASLSEQQRWSLDRIADVIATSAGVTADDLDSTPFHGAWGSRRRHPRSLAEMGAYLQQLNWEVTA